MVGLDNDVDSVINFIQMLTTVNSSFCQVSRELAAKECELRYATDNVERAKVACPY